MIYNLIPPSDPRVLTQVAPFTDELLKEHNLKTRQELSDNLFETMLHYKGIGLSANQCGLPFRVFVMGGHAQFANGERFSIFNPKVTAVSDQEVMMVEGCLTFPLLFVKIKRPAACKVEYEDVNGNKVEKELSGLTARCFLHEYDHMQGVIMTDRISKLKFDMAAKKREKLFKRLEKMKNARK